MIADSLQCQLPLVLASLAVGLPIRACSSVGTFYWWLVWHTTAIRSICRCNLAFTTMCTYLKRSLVPVGVAYAAHTQCVTSVCHPHASHSDSIVTIGVPYCWNVPHSCSLFAKVRVLQWYSDRQTDIEITNRWTYQQMNSWCCRCQRATLNWRRRPHCL